MDDAQRMRLRREHTIIESERRLRDEPSALRSWMWDEAQDREQGIPACDIVLFDEKDFEACKRYIRGQGYRVLGVRNLPRRPKDWGFPRVFLMVRSGPKTNVLVPKFRHLGDPSLEIPPIRGLKKREK